ncbi:MAG TPA: hypothetical protein DCP31_34475, partial [Cyanobacteria bacterium UBA8543]|nr:hypothetical protein [Cyanobacteria bacterium UBA8543]
VSGLERHYQTFNFSLNGSYTTHRFIWTSKDIYFQSFHGHGNDQKKKIAEWYYKPQEKSKYIPRQPLPIYLNLWLFKGQPPTDLQEVEVIVSQFKFTPCS